MKKEKGITLVSLVITIVVMLIIAGVSLSVILGEDSPVKRAAQAVDNWRDAIIREEVNMILSDFTVEGVLHDDDAFTNFLQEKLDNGQFQEYLYAGMYFVKYKDRYCELRKHGFGYEVFKILDGDINSEYVIITPNTIEKNEKIELESEKKYIVLDSVDAKDFDFDVKAGDHVSIRLVGNMVIDNKDVKRSAINLGSGSTLDLYVYGNVVVNSGYGENAAGNTPGKGGYAGIHVPESATLNLFGTGVLTAIGGDAGDGEKSDTKAYHAGGGGAGAGIGGKGGDGGAGKAGASGSEKVCPSGGTGGSCGTVNIYESLTVIAYGGGGGSGGSNTQDYGAGAGGYPGAGIGGGGAGGAGATCCAGAGGYTGGSAEGNPKNSFNGYAGQVSTIYNNPGKSTGMTWQGGGYYEGQDSLSGNNNYLIMKTNLLGGMGGCSFYPGHSAGDGGTAGKGGKITVSQNAKVYAYNGNRYTDGTSYLEGGNQAVIYAQAGIGIKRYKHTESQNHNYPQAENTNRYLFSVTKDKHTIKQSSYQNTKNIGKVSSNINMYLNAVDMSKQGVGSGAGYIELSNGTYEVSATLNEPPLEVLE